MNKFHSTRNRALNDRVTSSSSGWFSTRFSMSFVSCSQLSADNLLCRLGGSDLLDLVYFRFFWKWNQLELRHLCISVLPVNWCASHQQKLLFLIMILLYLTISIYNQLDMSKNVLKNLYETKFCCNYFSTLLHS